MVSIQNATLAGGVAVGASSNLFITPAGAFFVGATAGLISTAGFEKLQSKLEEGPFKLHDSCGVNNLHGMPAWWGAIMVSVFTSPAFSFVKPGTLEYPRGDLQGAAQIGGAILTFLMAVGSGTLVGTILRWMKFEGKKFKDDSVWDVDEHYLEEKKNK